MAYTDPELLDRLRETRNREADRPAVIVPLEPVHCDTCGFPVDDPGRFRHRECEARPVPSSISEAVDRLRAKRRSGSAR